MLDLAIQILRHFITFLSTIIALLEARQELAASEETTTEASLPDLFTPSATVGRSEASTPEPRRRSPRLANSTPERPIVFRPLYTPEHRSRQQLREHFIATRECTHACHLRNTRNFDRCPICGTPLPSL